MIELYIYSHLYIIFGERTDCQQKIGPTLWKFTDPSSKYLGWRSPMTFRFIRWVEGTNQIIWGLSENLGNPAVYGHVMVILWSCSLWTIRSMQIGSSSRLRPSRRPPMCLAVSQLVHPKVVWQCYACHHSGKICKIHGFWMFLEISSFDSIHVWGSLRSLRESWRWIGAKR